MTEQLKTEHCRRFSCC